MDVAFENERANMLIKIGNKTITYAEYIKQKRANTRLKKKNKRRRKVVSDLQILSSEIDKMVKSVKIIKSLAAYYDNSYKQWGVIAKEITNNAFYSKHFVHFRVLVREISNNLTEISALAKERTNDVYQFVEKLFYQIDELKETLILLRNGINESRICEFYNGKEAIEGSKDGKRLGLITLLIRSLKAIDQMEDISKHLEDVSANGADVSTYGLNAKRVD